MFVDIGAYGIPRAAWKGTFDPRKSGMAVEAFVREVQGFQMLYADVYLDRPAFEVRQLRHPFGRWCGVVWCGVVWGGGGGLLRHPFRRWCGVVWYGMGWRGGGGGGCFDIRFDHFSRISQLHPTPHTPCDMLCLAPTLIGG